MVRARRRSSIRAIAPCVLLVVATGVSAQQAPASSRSQSRRATGWSSRRRRRHPTSAPQSCEEGRQRRGRGGRDGVRAGGDAPVRRQHRRRRIHGRSARGRDRDDVRLPRTRAAKSTPTMYLGATARSRASSRRPAISRRACRARCAAWRSRTSASASCRGRTSSCPRRELAAKRLRDVARRSRAASTAKSRAR